MSAASDFAKDENEPGADSQSGAMKDQLSKEVAAWNKQRDEPVGEFSAARLAPAETAPRRASAGKKKANPIPPAAQTSLAPSKPFSMSYDGQTQADYARTRLDRKSR